MYVSKKVKSGDFSLLNQLQCKSTLIFENCKKIWYFCNVFTLFMLQRIQTIFLIIAALCGLALFYTAQDVILFGTNNLIVSALGIFCFLLATISIFSFKKRTRQILLNNISIFINALLIGALLYWLLNLSGGISFPEKGIELLFPLTSLVCLFIANLYIKRDEKLVKSVDRLR